ncbi:TetR/AcrR family transcriptional regulator [Sulfitobacter sp. JB4-11]|uniref:TetR/AcrR family transcriptional regulator n=1 Tax=Sulfitobacter rhodophyticola TaxID=3238304 RepID=UPI003D81427D
MRVRKTAAVRKAEITQAALDLAFQMGPDRVTTAMIAERLGLTQPAIYKHFPNKDDVWRTVTEALCQRIDDNIGAAQDQPEPLARLRALVIGQIRLLQDYPALPEIMVMRDPGSGTTELRSEVLNSVGGLREAIHAAICAAQTSGQIRSDLDVDDCTALIISIVQGLALRLLRFRRPEDLISIGERLLSVQLLLLMEKAKVSGDSA